MTKPVLVRDDNTLGPTALKMVEDMAASNKTQGTIAATLGMSKKHFEKMLARGKGDNPERLAWERGHCRLEQRIADAMLSQGLGELVEEDEVGEDGQTVIDEATGEPKKIMVRHTSKIGGTMLIYYSKAHLGWNEKPTGINIENKIQLVLPESYTTEAYFKLLGQDAPLDFRKDKTKPLPTIKDITGEALALPPPDELEEKPK